MAVSAGGGALRTVRGNSNAWKSGSHGLLRAESRSVEKSHLTRIHVEIKHLTEQLLLSARLYKTVCSHITRRFGTAHRAWILSKDAQELHAPRDRKASGGAASTARVLHPVSRSGSCELSSRQE